MNENLPQLDNTLKTNSPESPNGSLRPSRSPFKDISNTKLSKPIVCGKESFPKSSDTSWSERTEVITKQCHENYVSYSQEVVDKMVDEAFVISEEKNKFSENARRKTEGDSDSEYEDAVDEYDDKEASKDLTACNQLDSSNLSSPHSQEEKNTEPIDAIDKEVKGALELLKSFEKLGVSSPNTCRASLERAQTRLSDNIFNSFSHRISNGDSQKCSDLQTSLECQTNFENENIPDPNIDFEDSKAHKVLSLDKSLLERDATTCVSTNTQDDKLLSTSVVQDKEKIHLPDHESYPANMINRISNSLISPDGEFDASSSCNSHISETEKFSVSNDLSLGNLLVSKDSVKCDVESSENAILNVVDPSTLKSNNCAQLSESLIEKNVTNNLKESVNLLPEECDIRVASQNSLLDIEDSSFNKDKSVIEIISIGVENEGQKDKKDALMNKISEKGNHECKFENHGNPLIDSSNNTNYFETIVSNFMTLTVQNSPTIKPQGIEDNIEGISNSCIKSPVKKSEKVTEDTADTITTVSTVENSPVSLPQVVKDELDDIVNPLYPELVVESSPHFKPLTKNAIDPVENSQTVKSPFVMNSSEEFAEASMTNLAKCLFSDSFTTKSTVKNFSEMKDEIVKDNIEDLADTFIVKPDKENSVECKPQVAKVISEDTTNCLSPKSVEKSPVRKLEDVKENIFRDAADPFSMKPEVENSPVNKTPVVKYDFEDISGSLTTKSVVKKDSVLKTEYVKENFEDIADPCTVKSHIKISPVYNPEILKGNSEDSIDPLSTKSVVEISPVRKPDDVKANFEDTGDPFRTKSVIENSPVNITLGVKHEVKENSDSFTIKLPEDVKNGFEDIVDTITAESVRYSPLCKLEIIKDDSKDIVDPFYTKSVVENSPVRKPENLKDKEDTVHSICTKLGVKYSPARKYEAGNNCSEDIADFTINSAVKNSPLKDNFEEISDPFSTKSVIENSPLSKPLELKNNFDGIIDTFAGEHVCQKLPFNKFDENIGSKNDDNFSVKNISSKEVNFENINDPVSTNSVVKNSLLREPEDVKDNSTDIVDPLPSKSPEENSPPKKSEYVDDKFEDVDPFCTKSTVKNSPGKPKDAKDNFEDITDPFTTKSAVRNSPITKPENVEDNFEDVIDHISTKSVVENSPIRKPEDVKDNITDVDSLSSSSTLKKISPRKPEGAEDNFEDVDPFCTKSTVKNSPPRKPKDAEDNFEDIIDPFSTKSVVRNSPIRKHDNIKDVIDSFSTQTAVENSPGIKCEDIKDNFEDIIDPLPSKSAVNDSQLKTPKDVKENFEYIADPFETQSAIKNSPLRKPDVAKDNFEDTANSYTTKSDMKNFSIRKSGDVEDNYEDITAPFATKSVVENSPVRKCEDIKYNFEDITDPLPSKSAVKDSQIKTPKDVKENFEDIADPFDTQSVIKNSPLRKPEDAEDNFEDTVNSFTIKSDMKNFSLRKPGDVEDNFEDITVPFATKSAVENTQISKLHNVENNIEEILNPFDGKHTVQNSPMNKFDDNVIRTSNSSFPTENDSSKEDSLNNTLVLDSTIVQGISSNNSSKDTFCNSTVFEDITVVNAKDDANSSVSKSLIETEEFLAKDFSNTSDTVNQIFDTDEKEKLDVGNAREMRKSISSIEFDIIAKEALDLAKDVTPQPVRSRKDQINKTLESIKMTNFSQEEFASAKEFFSNEDELDALENFGNNEKNQNLARNSLFVKFDPLLAASVENSSDARRGSTLMKFSPFKKPSQESFHSSLLNADTTASESTLLDETLMSDCNTTVLVKVEEKFVDNTCKSSMSTATQTELEMVSVEEKESAIKKLEIMSQDKLLRSSREHEEIKEALVYELRSKDLSLKEAEDSANQLRCLVKQFETLMEKMVAKKDSMEKELLDQLKVSDEKYQLEIEGLKQKLQRQEDDSAASDQAFFELVKKHDRLRQVAQTLKNNNFFLEERNKELEENLAEKKGAFVKAVKELEEKMKEVDTKNGEEMKKLENEMSRSAFLLKRAEMKIISLTESNKKKDEEIAMLSGLLDDCSSKFGS